MKSAISIILVIIAVAFMLSRTSDGELEVTEQNNMTKTISFTLTSPAFEMNGSIPSRFTCDESGVQVPLSIDGVPADAQSLALIMRDPDIPEFVKKSRDIEDFIHWVVYNMPTTTQEIMEDIVPIGTLGVNTVGTTAYIGPCPPDGRHRYFFTIFALDTTLDLTKPTADVLTQAMAGHIIAKTELVGMYQRK